MIVSLALDDRRKPTVSRADPPVIPVTDEISPNENLQLDAVSFPNEALILFVRINRTTSFGV